MANGHDWIENDHAGGLGRRKPKDWEHVRKYPFGEVAPATISDVERVLQLPYWHWSHDQGDEGACVGFGTSMMMAVVNLIQRRDADPSVHPWSVRYDAYWLWDQAKIADDWPDTNPGDDNGTSVRAGCDVLRLQGNVPVKNTYRPTYPYPSNYTPNPTHGIQAVRWAQSVDEMRTAVASANAVSIGIDWYHNFDLPHEHTDGSWWIGEGSLGIIRGGHCVCVYGASDKRQAFRVKNNWGREFPLVWLPYKTMEKLLSDDGEVAIITDR